MEYHRPAWVAVDASAITRNVRTLKALTPRGTRFMAVIKADGYGHGALEAAHAARAGGADRFGVATVDEALALRAAGVAEPLQILAEPPVEAAGLLVEHEIIATVTTREFASALSRAAVRAGRPAAYHLKIDTGMNRIGVRAEDVGETVAALRDLPGLVFEGAFTHFATADEPGDWEFLRQRERLDVALGQLRTERRRPPIVHAANSAATILHPSTHLDMVRCGIATYGLQPTPFTMVKVELVPAMSVKSRVSLVKRIGLGDGVSYGFTWHADGPTTIATVPIGYADGVHRVLSNKMRVLIGGRRCRQVGRICMDQLMVEVPKGLDARQGDEVVLVGTQGTERIAMEEMAELAGTINYELACGFALRLCRR